MNTLSEGRLHPTVKSLLALMVTAVLLLSGAVPAQAAPSIACGDDGRTYGWVTSPVAGQTAGAKHCRVMTPGHINGEYGFWFKSASGVWIPTSNNARNFGGPEGSAGRAHAEAAAALAARWGLTLHFTTYSGVGDRVGHLRSDGGYFLRGTYYPSPRRPGLGLIEISAGGGSLGVADAARGNAVMRTAILDTTRHEIAHARIEFWCGTWNPPIVGDRIEHVTDAYAVTALGRTPSNTTYGYTEADVATARAIAAGNCG